MFSETNYFNIDQEAQLIYAFKNCKEASIKDAMSKKIRNDQVQLGFSQNLLDQFGLPGNMHIDLSELLTHPLLKQDNVSTLIEKYF